jgi:hemoglobin
MPNRRDIFVPPEGPPTEGRPNPEIFAKMGQDNIFLMIEDLYRKLENSTIRHLFPEDMIEASKKSASFFVFLLGGPPLYHQKHGPPMMRQRHMPFAIDEAARQVWLACFDAVLENPQKYQFPEEHLPEFRRFLDRFSRWMVNTK